MGQSVLTPEESLLGTPDFFSGFCGGAICCLILLEVFGAGDREFGQNSETGPWGTETAK